MNTQNSYFKLCLVLDCELPLEILQNLIQNGITSVQLRMKDASEKVVISIAQKLLALLRPQEIPLIINDYVQVAKAIDADGVHIGQGDMPYDEARKMLGEKKIIGLSIENIAQAKIGSKRDVDYFGVGPIYPTATKLDASSPIGIIALKKIKNVLLPKPIIAIGGIDEYNIQPVLQAGVSGIAVASAILSAKDPLRVAQKLSQLILSSQLGEKIGKEK